MIADFVVVPFVSFVLFVLFISLSLSSLHSLNSLNSLIKLLPTQHPTPPNFLSEGVSCGLDKEIAPDGTYLKYFPFGAMIERSQMAPYHKKLEHCFNLRCYTLAIVTKLLIEYLEGC